MNASSMYESHIDVFCDVDPNAISLKYSIYTLAKYPEEIQNVYYFSFWLCSLQVDLIILNWKKNKWQIFFEF